MGNKVVHHRMLSLGQALSDDSVWIDRTSVWGNPFVIGRDGTRAEVIVKFRAWLWQAMGRSHTSDFSVNMVRTLNNKTLVCHCAPQPCHGDVIAAAIAWCVSQAQNNAQSLGDFS